MTSEYTADGDSEWKHVPRTLGRHVPLRKRPTKCRAGGVGSTASRLEEKVSLAAIMAAAVLFSLTDVLVRSLLYISDL